MATNSPTTAAPGIGWARRAVVGVLSLQFAGLSNAAAPKFPYVQSQIFMPSCVNVTACHGIEVAYLFNQNDNGAVEFLSLNYSAKIQQDEGYTSLTTKLPFLDGKKSSTAFSAARAGDGTILVYAGDCNDNTNTEMWRYIPGKEAGDGKEPGEWIKTVIGAKNEGSSTKSGSPYFLGGSFAFSAALAPKMDQPTMYTYGGMCLAPQSDTDGWQSAGTYTTAMMSMSPERGDIQTPYDVGVASSAGPRSPFAGFSMTQLPPSMTNISGTVTQQASFVFLGGHTQQAFLNISNAAVWNLPQQTWTYVDIRQPMSTSGKQEDILGGALRVNKRKVVPEVTSRSGHTAVVSADGESLVVLGGWVGDVATPATPQLAVLKMSQTYKSWEWTVPSAQPKAAGLYGHGATLLPGNVMMVYGGWEIGSSNTKRATSRPAQFLNLTSMEWATSYKTPVGFEPPHSQNPGSSGNSPDAPKADESSADRAKRLGLGLGLGLGFGILAIIGAIAAFCCIRNKRRRDQRARDSACQAMMRDSAHYFNDNDEMAERSGYSPWGTWAGNDVYNQAQQDRSLGYESLMSGARSTEYGGAGAASAAAGVSRKPVMQQQQRPGTGYGAYYSSADTRGMNAFVSVPGQIHPIIEDDEEDRPRSQMLPMTPTSEVHSDPFATPTHGSPTPHGARRHDPAVQEWVSDVDVAGSLLTQYNSRPGRTSPTKSNHTRDASLRDDESRSGSNLSESARSAADSLWKSTPHGGPYEGGKKGPGSSSSASYLTARTGFGGLQAEAPGLLGRSSPSGGFNQEEDETPGSPSKSKPRRGWLGSFRRVFSNSGPNPLVATTREDSPNRLSMDQASGDYEPHPSGVAGEVLRRKQGRTDWEFGEHSKEPENDWDIERAVEQRLVQVMFTVPKERLRVVNGETENDDDDAEEEELPIISPPDTPERRVSTNSHLQLPEVLAPSPLSLTPRIPSMEIHAPLGDFSAPAPSYDVFTGERSLTPRRQLMHASMPSTSVDLDREELLRLSRTGDLAEPRISHETDGTGRRSSPALFTAEAVTFERPKTRVLQMADSFERFADAREQL